MDRPTFSYPSELLKDRILKCLFKHMRVNTRIQLSQHVPQLRKIDSSVPLTMERLVLSSPSEFIVENTIFHVNYCSESDIFSEDSKQDEADKGSGAWMVCTMKSKRYSKMEKIRKKGATPAAAVEYLLNKFFGGRKSQPIQVDYLGLDYKGPFQTLPKTVVFKINDLKVTHDVSACIDAIEPFLDPSSFPLDTIFIKGSRTKTSGKYDHKHVASAQYLHIMDSAGCKFWSTKLQDFKNTQIHLQCPDVEVEQFLWLLECFIKTAKPPGTWISVGIDKFQDIKEVMNGVQRIPMARKEPSGTPCTSFTEAIVIPLTPIREMGVYVSQNTNLATHDRMFSQFDLNLCIFAVPLPKGMILKSTVLKAIEQKQEIDPRIMAELKRMSEASEAKKAAELEAKK